MNEYGLLVEWDSLKNKIPYKNSSQCDFVHHRTHRYFPGFEPRPRWYQYTIVVDVSHLFSHSVTVFLNLFIFINFSKDIT
jgi:hypothetical protein